MCTATPGEIPFPTPHTHTVTRRRSGQRRNSRHPPAKEQPRRSTAEHRWTARTSQVAQPLRRVVDQSGRRREEERREEEQGRMPHRARPMTGLLVFKGVNLVLLNTISPVHDFVCFHPYWERKRERRQKEREALQAKHSLKTAK